MCIMTNNNIRVVGLKTVTTRIGGIYKHIIRVGTHKERKNNLKNVYDMLGIARVPNQ